MAQFTNIGSIGIDPSCCNRVGDSYPGRILVIGAAVTPMGFVRLVFFSFALLIAPPALAKTYHYPSSGVSVTPPQGWVEIPATVTESITRSVGVSIPGLGGPRFRIGFQPGPNRGWMQPPFILLVISNSGRIDKSRIREMESLDLSLTLAGENGSLAPGGEVKVGKSHYEPENHLIWQRAMLPIGPNGATRVLSGTLLTQLGYIKILGYSPVAEYGHNEEIFRKITASIELAEWLRYQPTQSGNFFTRQSGGFWITILAFTVAAWMTNWLGSDNGKKRGNE